MALLHEAEVADVAAQIVERYDSCRRPPYKGLGRWELASGAVLVAWESGHDCLEVAMYAGSSRSRVRPVRTAFVNVEDRAGSVAQCIRGLAAAAHRELTA